MASVGEYIDSIMDASDKLRTAIEDRPLLNDTEWLREGLHNLDVELESILAEVEEG